MKMFKYNFYTMDIKTVNVLKKTAKTVVLENGERVHIECDWKKYFDTFEEAYEFLLSHTDKRFKDLLSEYNWEIEQILEARARAKVQSI